MLSKVYEKKNWSSKLHRLDVMGCFLTFYYKYATGVISIRFWNMSRIYCVEKPKEAPRVIQRQCISLSKSTHIHVRLRVCAYVSVCVCISELVQYWVNLAAPAIQRKRNATQTHKTIPKSRKVSSRFANLTVTTYLRNSQCRAMASCLPNRVLFFPL